ASAYVTVSRSGETWSPQISVSSPVLPMTVRSCWGTHAARPLKSLAAPVPPASVTTRMLLADGFAQGPQCAAAAPGVEAGARPAPAVGAPQEKAMATVAGQGTAAKSKSGRAIAASGRGR